MLKRASGSHSTLMYLRLLHSSYSKTEEFFLRGNYEISLFKLRPSVEDIFSRHRSDVQLSRKEEHSLSLLVDILLHSTLQFEQNFFSTKNTRRPFNILSLSKNRERQQQPPTALSSDDLEKYWIRDMPLAFVSSPTDFIISLEIVVDSCEIMAIAVKRSTCLFQKAQLL